MERRTWLRRSLCLLVMAALLLCGAWAAERANADSSHTVTMSLEKTNIISEERITCEVSAPGATALRVKFGTEIRGYWDESDHFVFEDVFHNIAGTYNVVAQACWDDDPEAEDSTWVSSEPVSVTVTSPNGNMPVPNFTPETTSVVRGEFLRVTLNNPDAYANLSPKQDFGISAVLSDSSKKTWDVEAVWDEVNNTLLVPTGRIPAGECILHGYAWAYGYTVGESAQTITITEPSYTAGTHPIFMNIDKTTAQVLEEYRVSAYAPDATALWVYWWEENEEEWIPWDGYFRGSGFSYVDAADRAFEALKFTVSACYGDPENEDDWTEPGETVVTIVITSAGPLDNATLSCPVVYTKGQAFPFSFTSVTHAETYYVDILDVQNDWNEIWSEEYTQAGEYSLDAGTLAGLEPGRSYKLEIGASGRNYDSSYNSIQFYVSDGEIDDETVTLTINGRDEEEFTVWANTPAMVSIVAPGAVQLQFNNGEEWRWDNGDWEDVECVNGYCNRTWDFDGSFRLVAARALFPDEGEGHWVYSNVIRLITDVEGSLDEPEFEAPASVTRGDPLTVTINEVTGATHYNMDIWSDEIGFNMHLDRVNPGQIVIPTEQLTPGVYKIGVNACAEKANWVGSEKTLTVTGSEEIDERTIYLSILPDPSLRQVTTGEWFNMVVYAPGADEIQVYDHETDNYDESFWGEGGDFLSGDHRRDDEQDWTLYARARYGEDWIESERINFSITAENDLPRVTATFTPGVFLNAGQALTVSVAPVEGAQEYTIDIEDIDEFEGDQYTSVVSSSTPISEPLVATIPAGFFQPGRSYKIHVGAYAPNHEATREDFVVQVLDETKPVSITLTVNGSTENQTIWTGENMRVSVSVPESLNVTGLCVNDGEDGWHYVVGDSFSEDWGYGSPRVLPIIARYTTDPIELDEEGNPTDGDWWQHVTWAGYSNAVTVNYMSHGDMPGVEASFASPVTRGELMEITIENAAAFKDAQYEDLWLNAEAYTSDYGPDEGSEDWWFGRYEWDGDHTILLPTAEMLSGHTYELHLRSGAHGWSESETVYSFSVVDPATSEPIFTADKTVVLTRENYTISAYVPGAEAIRIDTYEPDGNHWDEAWDGESVVWDRCENRRGVYAFTLFAHYPDDESDWTPLPNTLSVTANSNGELVPEAFIVGQFDESNNYTFTVVDEHGDPVACDDIDVNVWRDRDGQFIWQDYSNRRVDDATFIIPAVIRDSEDRGHNRFSGEIGDIVLEEGEIYNIQVTVNKVGYESRHLASKHIFVGQIAEQAQDFTLTINGKSDRKTVQINEDMYIEVNAPENATAIRVYTDNNTDGNHWLEFQGNTAEGDFSWGGFDSDVPVFARYATDPIPEDDNGFDWNTLNWSDTISNIVYLSTTKVAELSRPSVNAPASVERGQLVEVSVNYPEEGCDYHAEFDMPDVGRWNRVDWDGNGSVYLPTANLEPGDYRVLVSNHGKPGYQGAETFKDITITDSDELVFAVDRTNVVTRENFTMTAYVPGAQQIRIILNGDEDDRWFDGETYFVSENWWRIDDSGDYVFSLEWLDEAGEWHTFDQTITMRVTAPFGQIQLPNVAFSSNGNQLGSNVVLTQGDGLHVELNPGDVDLDFAHMWVNYQDETGMAHWSDNRNAGDGWSFDVPADALDRIGNYHIGLNVYGKGYEWNNLNYYFVVTDGEESDIKLRINGRTTSPARVLINEPFTVKVTGAPSNATAIALYNGHDWEHYFGNTLEMEQQQSEVATLYWYAKYTTDTDLGDEPDWGSLEWNAIGNVIAVTATANGQLPAPEYTVNKTTITRGEMLTVTIVNPYEGAGYNAALLDVDSGRWYERRNWDGERIDLSTIELEPGVYQLNTDVYGVVGLENNSTPMDITVLPPETDRPIVQARQLTAATHEDFAVGVYAQGADWVELRLTMEHEPDWFDSRFNVDRDDEGNPIVNLEEDEQRPYGEWWFNYDRGDTYWLTPVGHYGNETVVGDSVSFEVWSNGTLSDPNLIMPAVLTLGQDLNVSFEPVQDAEWYHVDYQFIPDEGDWINLGEIPNMHETSFTIDKSVFQEHGPGTYRVHVGVFARGKENGGNTGKRFVVTDSLDSNVILTVNGEQADLLNLPCNENIHIVIDAPGATALRFYDDNWHYNFYDDGGYTEHSGHWEFDRSFPPEMFSLSAQACYVAFDPDAEGFDPASLNWSGTSNGINVRAVAYGTLDQPQYTLASASLTRGDILVVNITGNQDHDEWYGAEIGWTDDSERFGYHHWDDQTRTVTIPTIDLEPGEYNLWVYTDAVGYYGNEANATITVNAPQDGMNLAVYPTQVVTMRQADCYVFAPGATDISAVMTKEGDEGWRNEWSWTGDEIDNGVVQFGAGSGGSGYYTITVTATMANGATQTRTANLEITAPNGQLNVFVDMPGMLMAGEDLNFRVYGDYIGDIGISIWDNETGDNPYSWDGNIHFGWEGGEHSDTVDASRLEAGKSYRMDVYAAAEGWNETGLSREFRVVDSFDDLSTLTLPAALSVIEDEAFCGIDAQRVVIPDGVTTIGSRAFADCPNLVLVEIPSTVTFIADDAFEGSPMVTFSCGSSYVFDYAENHHITVR